MAPDLSVVACPGCGAAVRPDAPWCTQCFRGLLPGEPEQPAPTPAPRTPVATLEGEPSWPCAACGAANPMTADACAGCGLGFLSLVHAQERPVLALPGLGDVTRRSRGQLAAAACGAVLVVVLLCLVLFLAIS